MGQRSSEPFNHLLRSTLLVCHNTGLGALQGIKGFTAQPRLCVHQVSSLLPHFHLSGLALPVGSVNVQSRDTSRTKYRHCSNHLITTPSLFSSFDTMRFSL